MKEGALFKDKIVFMVTYDLDQAQQMDWVLHLSDSGELARSASSKEFFASQNTEELDKIKSSIKLKSGDAEAEEISEPTESP